ncbi:MAG: bifunctional 4-hydroxy-2-oxoglutarate aldolase/2-dehydro-3-deoxy-phosphogluconate aldolase [Ignavibacteriae bacterium]|nr:bifunctional 4-hydroxy-2-oxoglutarate aldolase/2-dehydro-3-deoxy-phosphogluconate aldolase [Ignavibacteriota bacterium]
MNKILEEIGLLGIVPVIAIDNADDAEPLAKALVDGGLPCAEVTFRTSAAKEAITRIAKAYPSMMLGAGTVLTVEQVKSAFDCGAKYIVSPGLNTKVVEYCVQKNIPVTPGVATPTEVEMALEQGLEVVKFFPAEANGGLPFLKAISAPYKSLKFIPTGGIDETNLLSYLKFNKVLACGGSWMVKSDLINNKQFDEIKRLTSQAMMKMLGFELRHVGINNADASTAMEGASRLASLFGLAVKDGNSSVFVGTQFELLKRMYLGAHGHLAIGTNFVDRAVACLSKSGVGVKPETKVEKDGKIATVYLDIEIGGFAVHLVQL